MLVTILVLVLLSPRTLKTYKISGIAHTDNKLSPWRWCPPSHSENRQPSFWILVGSGNFICLFNCCICMYNLIILKSCKKIKGHLSWSRLPCDSCSHFISNISISATLPTMKGRTTTAREDRGKCPQSWILENPRALADDITDRSKKNWTNHGPYWRSCEQSNPDRPIID